jgi:hypothetical protein
MPHNHAALRSGRLFQEHKRAPGHGRFRASLEQAFDRLEKEAQKAGEKGLQGAAAEVFKRLGTLFAKRPAQHIERKSRKGILPRTNA